MPALKQNRRKKARKKKKKEDVHYYCSDAFSHVTKKIISRGRYCWWVSFQLILVLISYSNRFKLDSKNLVDKQTFYADCVHQCYNFDKLMKCVVHMRVCQHLIRTSNVMSKPKSSPTMTCQEQPNFSSSSICKSLPSDHSWFQKDALSYAIAEINMACYSLVRDMNNYRFSKICWLWW